MVGGSFGTNEKTRNNNNRIVNSLKNTRKISLNPMYLKLLNPDDNIFTMKQSGIDQ